MSERYTDLRQKEVVNLCDGKRLGCICDVIIDVTCGKVEAIVVPGQCGITSIFKAAKTSLSHGTRFANSARTSYWWTSAASDCAKTDIPA